MSCGQRSEASFRIRIGEMKMKDTMTAAFLPGNSTVEMRTVPVPVPGHGEVLLRIKASTICGSDIRCIYHEHLGKGPEGYQGVIAGHEPCGQIVAEGPGLSPLQDRRPRHRLPHLRLRRVQRLPARLHDLLHQREVSPRLRMAARRRHGRVHDRRREGPHRAARSAFLRRRRAGGLRIRHRLRGP